MFIRIFVEANDKEEALKYSKEFENIILNCVVDIKITKIEQYWKMPELYCVEFEFSDVIPERINEVSMMRKFCRFEYRCRDIRL